MAYINGGGDRRRWWVPSKRTQRKPRKRKPFPILSSKYVPRLLFLVLLCVCPLKERCPEGLGTYFVFVCVLQTEHQKLGVLAALFEVGAVAQGAQLLQRMQSLEPCAHPTVRTHPPHHGWHCERWEHSCIVAVQICLNRSCFRVSVVGVRVGMDL